MPRIKYKDKKFSDLHLDFIQKINATVKAYKAQGYSLTLRQVYYKFVSNEWFPADWADPVTKSTNNERSYSRLGSILTDGRMAGLIDWHAIVDRTRELDGNVHYNNPKHILDLVGDQYKIDKWETNPYRVQVWVEKDALENVVGKAAKALDCDFFSCRGYTSLTAIWDAAQKLAEYSREGQTPVILHLGDHDPSGIDMTRDIEARTRMFMGEYGDSLILNRIALNMDQIEEYNPPENPAKVSDPRASNKDGTGYIATYGTSSWELDALEPAMLNRLIRMNILKYLNQGEYDKLQEKENKERSLLKTIGVHWTPVSKHVLDSYSLSSVEEEEEIEPEQESPDDESQTHQEETSQTTCQGCGDDKAELQNGFCPDCARLKQEAESEREDDEE